LDRFGTGPNRNPVKPDRFPTGLGKPCAHVVVALPESQSQPAARWAASEPIAIAVAVPLGLGGCCRLLPGLNRELVRNRALLQLRQAMFSFQKKNLQYLSYRILEYIYNIKCI
jgi:hypothetical protein